MHSLISESFERTFMVDRCEIRETVRDDQGVYNRTTRKTEYPVGDLVYSGCCSVQQSARINREIDSEGRELLQSGATLKLPRGSGPFEIGQTVQVTWTEDADLLDVTYEVAGIVSRSTSGSKTLQMRRLDQFPTEGR